MTIFVFWVAKVIGLYLHDSVTATKFAIHLQEQYFRAPCQKLHINTSLVQRPERLLNRNTKCTNTDHSPKPRILELVHARPEGILVGAELLQLCKLVGMRLRVAAHLMLLLLLVAAEEAQEAVVCDGTEQLNWGQHVTAVEHDDEGDVNQGVSEVAVTCYKRVISEVFKTYFGLRTMLQTPSRRIPRPPSALYWSSW
jgi:hypothetical protein